MKKATRRATPRSPLTAIDLLDPVQGGARAVIIGTGSPSQVDEDSDARAVIIITG